MTKREIEENGGARVPAGETEVDVLDGRPARRQSLSGGDAELLRRYVLVGDRVIVFRYERPTGPPALDATRDGPLAILATLRWRSP